MRTLDIAPVAALGMTLFASGCAHTAAEDPPRDLPDRASFPLVMDAIERRCATLDCHGSPLRNLRLYSGSGLRLSTMDVPGSGATTDAEYEASYRSLTGLEPEILSEVVAEKGREPERLTLLRKARGLEYHKPGVIISAGDPADRCVTTWLASAIDEDQCMMGADVSPPSMGGGGGAGQ